jgi:hypothetical protein
VRVNGASGASGIPDFRVEHMPLFFMSLFCADDGSTTTVAQADMRYPGMMKFQSATNIRQKIWGKKTRIPNSCFLNFLPQIFLPRVVLLVTWDRKIA